MIRRQRAAGRQPLLLVLENLHWADVASLELLHFAAAQVASARVVVFATYQAEALASLPPLQRVVRSCVGRTGALEVLVPPFEPADLVQLCRKAIGAGGPGVEAFAAQLHAWTHGNALFASELLASLLSRDVAPPSGHVWLGWQAGVSHLAPTLREAVRARLAALSEPARVVAGMLAVIGNRVPLDLLRRVAAADASSLGDRITELVRRGIVSATRSREGPVYDFVHPIVRDVLYADIDDARAHEWHIAVVLALESLHGDRIDRHAAQLAPHLPYAMDRLERSARCPLPHRGCPRRPRPPRRS